MDLGAASTIAAQHQAQLTVCPTQVRANPELRGVVATGANTLPQAVVEDAFRDQYGRTLNFRAFKDSLGKVNRWYEERGIFGQARACLAALVTVS